MVGTPDEKMPVPKFRTLLESGAELAEEMETCADAYIAVYSNGFVCYQMQGHITVFPITAVKGDYYYETALRENDPEYSRGSYVIPEEALENDSWYIRLSMEGEDRIRENLQRSHRKYNVSYDAEAEDWSAVCAEDAGYQKVADELEIEQLRRILTEKQRRVLNLYFFEGLTVYEIADMEHISRQAVSDFLKKGIMRIRKIYGISGSRIFLGRNG